MSNLLDDFRRVTLPAEAEAFRAEVREFLATSSPPAAPEQCARSWTGYDAAFSRRLAQRGWVGLTLPRQRPGAGALQFGAIRRRQRHDVGDGAAEQRGAVGLGPGPVRCLLQDGGLGSLLAQRAAHAGQRLEGGGGERTATGAFHAGYRIGAGDQALPSASR